jgi:serine/threonine-protein kinase RsbW
VAIVVEDEGVGFDPAAVPDPTRPENVDIPSGRGIMLMRAYMTEVEFDPPGNRVRMTFKKKAPR